MHVQSRGLSLVARFAPSPPPPPPSGHLAQLVHRARRRQLRRSRGRLRFQFLDGCAAGSRPDAPPAAVTVGANAPVQQGSKRWTIWDAAALPLLNPDYMSGFDPVFPDLNDGSVFGHERSAAACPYDSVLQAGEVLFVPHGCPHRVSNLSASIAISANFCDGSNIGAAVEELDIAALVGGEAQARVARELRAVISAAAGQHGAVHEGQDAPRAEFKGAIA